MNLSPKERFISLSPREREVLSFVCQYKKYREIAETLFIETTTVKTHMRKVYRKLGLMHMDRDERIMRIRTTYCPMFSTVTEISQAIEVIEPEPDPEPLTPEEDDMLIKDEFALVAYAHGEMAGRMREEKKPMQKKKRRGGFRLIGVLIVLGLLAFAVFKFWPSAQNVVTGYPAGVSNPVYEIGEWHQVDDVAIRLLEYETDNTFISFVVEFWNKSDQTLYFTWTPGTHTFLIDNLGRRFTALGGYNNDTEVKAGDRIILDNLRGNMADYSDEFIYESGVTDIYLLVEDISRIDKVYFHVEIGK